VSGVPGDAQDRAAAANDAGVVDSSPASVLEHHARVRGPTLGGDPLGIESVSGTYEFDEHQGRTGHRDSERPAPADIP